MKNITKASVAFACLLLGSSAAVSQANFIRVEVKNLRGVELQGAQVKASWLGKSLHFTDNKGKAKLRYTPRESAWIAISKQGYRSVRLPYDFSRNHRRRVKVVMRPIVMDNRRPTSPPPARPFVKRPQSRLGFIWITGHYEWNGGSYKWASGHWERPRVGQRWVAGRWVRAGRYYVWHPGRWVKTTQLSCVPTFPKLLQSPMTTTSRCTGLPIFAIPLRGSHSRASDNFARIVGFDYRVRATLQNVLASDLHSTRMTVRGDRANRSDKDRSPVFSHDPNSTFWISGKRATHQRGNFIGHIQSLGGSSGFNLRNPNAILVLEVIEKR